MPVLQAGMADIPGDENAATVLIKHGPVDTFMPGMTMEFHLVTPSDLKGISIGQTVEGDVSRRGDEYWIDHLHPAGAK